MTTNQEMVEKIKHWECFNFSASDSNVTDAQAEYIIRRITHEAELRALENINGIQIRELLEEAICEGVE